MTITVDISPEVQAELERQAAARGIDVPAYIATLLEKVAQPDDWFRSTDQGRPGRRSLAQLFAESPFAGLDLDFGRDPDLGRDIEL